MCVMIKGLKRCPNCVCGKKQKIHSIQRLCHAPVCPCTVYVIRFTNILINEKRNKWVLMGLFFAEHI